MASHTSKETQQLPATFWARVDGTEAVVFGSETVVRPSFDSGTHGKWAVTKSNLAVAVDAKGHIFVSTYCASAETELFHAGYQIGLSHNTLLSVGDSIDGSVIETIKCSAARAKVERSLADRSDLSDPLHDLRQQFGRVTGRIATDELSDAWMIVNGIQYQRPGRRGTHTVPLHDDPQHFQRQMETVGCFCVRAGVIALVDQEGRTWIAKRSAETEHDALTRGYRPADVDVPFANGEIAIDPEQQRRLQATLGLELDFGPEAGFPDF